MYLSDDDPASEETQETFSGYNTKSFRSYLIDQGLNLPYGYGVTYIYSGYNGLIDDKGFTSIKWYGGNYKNAPYFYFLQKDGTEVGKYKCDSFDGKYDSLPTIVFNKYTAGGRTFRLFNLPTNKGGASGVVYQDGEGYLRVTI